MFQMSVSKEVGDGRKALFWQDRWLEGASIQQLAPNLITAVCKKVRKVRTVRDAFHHNQRIQDISGSLSMPALAQYVLLWIRLQNSALWDAPDKFVWKWSANRQYSAASAYRAFFHGQCGLPGAKELSKARASPACKFFFWLAILGRCWTSSRLPAAQPPKHAWALCSL
jgi:hypothetical protein